MLNAEHTVLDPHYTFTSTAGLTPTSGPRTVSHSPFTCRERILYSRTCRRSGPHHWFTCRSRLSKRKPEASCTSRSVHFCSCSPPASCTTWTAESVHDARPRSWCINASAVGRFYWNRLVVVRIENRRAACAHGTCAPHRQKCRREAEFAPSFGRRVTWADPLCTSHLLDGPARHTSQRGCPGAC